MKNGEMACSNAVLTRIATESLFFSDV